MNTALAAPCVLDESSPDFLIPAECSIENITGLQFSNLRFSKVDNNPGVNLTNDPGNLIRFGAASYSFSFFTPVFDTRVEGCPLSFNASIIEQNDEIAFFTAARANRRSISVAWILDCEIVQDR
jgi:hypothetical protein